ncbi:MAG: NAD(P)/FAD-dependent oxidoreductase [Deltaproteobacteria bacterium]|nr:NAD(P)/FAD-dependent oxidoreductase [Deltaproteobacteria bacterium]MBW2415958.1 NAD(P)/FAD-dependent oxidoreductase [Deltaproteobacteria bacterium]
MLHRLRALGLSTRVYEIGDGVGGTWYWNRYPGARCDIESMEYSYQFSDELQQEWEWTERFASQPEILRYANHVADRFDLRSDVRFETRVEAATFDEAAGRWSIRTDRGSANAAFLILATGCLSSRNTPDFEGLESFEGEAYHTGEWPHEGVDFGGKRVGIIGTGSSAIQATPLIAEEAEHLYVFQRTPNYSIPARNASMDPEYQASIKANYAAFREQNSQSAFGASFVANEVDALSVSAEEREREFDERWQTGGLGFITAYQDLLFSQEANDTAAAFVRARIREKVSDPAVADALSPDHVLGCKRPCLDTGYFETFNRPNVTLVDISDSPIETITPGGLRAKGRDFDLDCIVFATGFDAMTGAVLGIDIRGRAGQTLRDKWSAGPRTYLGLQTAGFPNLFTITGPGSPSVLSNMLPSIEQHANWIGDCIGWMREQGRTTIEATVEAEDAWVAHVNEVAGETLYPTCNSWYLGANVPGKPRVFMPYLGFPPYVEKCNEVSARGYEGFTTGGP